MSLLLKGWVINKFFPQNNTSLFIKRVVVHILPIRLSQFLLPRHNRSRVLVYSLPILGISLIVKIMTRARQTRQSGSASGTPRNTRLKRKLRDEENVSAVSPLCLDSGDESQAHRPLASPLKRLKVTPVLPEFKDRYFEIGRAHV